MPKIIVSRVYVRKRYIIYTVVVSVALWPNLSFYIAFKNNFCALVIRSVDTRGLRERVRKKHKNQSAHQSAREFLIFTHVPISNSERGGILRLRPRTNRKIARN